MRRWILLVLFLAAAGDRPAQPAAPIRSKVRILHGAIATVLTLYVAFHLMNHMFGWAGPETHRMIMAAGRRVYRSA